MTGNILADFVVTAFVVVLGTIAFLPVLIVAMTPAFLLLQGIKALLGGGWSLNRNNLF